MLVAIAAARRVVLPRMPVLAESICAPLTVTLVTAAAALVTVKVAFRGAGMRAKV